MVSRSVGANLHSGVKPYHPSKAIYNRTIPDQVGNNKTKQLGHWLHNRQQASARISAHGAKPLGKFSRSAQIRGRHICFCTASFCSFLVWGVSYLTALRFLDIDFCAISCSCVRFVARSKITECAHEFICAPRLAPRCACAPSMV